LGFPGQSCCMICIPYAYYMNHPSYSTCWDRPNKQYTRLSPWRWRQWVPPKRQSVSKTLHGATSQKRTIRTALHGKTAVSEQVCKYQSHRMQNEIWTEFERVCLTCRGDSARKLLWRGRVSNPRCLSPANKLRLFVLKTHGFFKWIENPSVKQSDYPETDQSTIT
jgi:hypothetical protein